MDGDRSLGGMERNYWEGIGLPRAQTGRGDKICLVPVR